MMTTFNIKTKRVSVVILASTLFGTGAIGCDGLFNPDLPFGETAIVVVINPEVNDGNTTAVPASLGFDRE